MSLNEVLDLKVGWGASPKNKNEKSLDEAEKKESDFRMMNLIVETADQCYFTLHPIIWKKFILFGEFMELSKGEGVFKLWFLSVQMKEIIEMLTVGEGEGLTGARWKKITDYLQFDDCDLNIDGKFDTSYAKYQSIITDSIKTAVSGLQLKNRNEIMKVLDKFNGLSFTCNFIKQTKNAEKCKSKYAHCYSATHVVSIHISGKENLTMFLLINNFTIDDFGTTFACTLAI